jgi:ligand-binding SRPBCC domain-containing protein
MPEIIHKEYIQAPVRVCFNLARSVDIHPKTVSHTKEKAVAGVTTGLVEEGDQVTWEAVHFGVRQRLTAKITRMEKYNLFVDEMVRGAFHSFVHTHEFKEEGEFTVMTDVFRYKSPFGIIGVLADKLFLEKYMERFIVTRSSALKELAERQGDCDVWQN